jgi:hypothetical protein
MKAGLFCIMISEMLLLSLYPKSQNYRCILLSLLLLLLIRVLHLLDRCSYWLSHSTSPFFCDRFFSRYGSINYLPATGFKPWSSWSLPPEYLGLQVWTTDIWFLLSLEEFYNVNIWDGKQLESCQGVPAIQLRGYYRVTSWGQGSLLQYLRQLDGS